ncbi:MAG: sensor histidine kinase [Acidimicrobiales bacterium]
MAIRTRILLVVVALVFLALTILDVVSFTVVRHSLIARTDAQLQAAGSQIQSHVDLHQLSPAQLCDGLPLHSFGSYYTMQGRFQITTPCFASSPSSPARRNLGKGLIAAADISAGPVFATLSNYRVMVQFVPASASGTGFLFAVGEPLAPVNSTLGSVLVLEIIVTGTILIAVGAAAHFLVQLGLRPLEYMAGTAGEIAAGDLSRRVEDADERTEVGRLGTSLNVMLSRIEQAFREKEASEAQLRRFVADASHELRTPLTSIRGYAELFRDGGGMARPDDLAAALRRIETESARMSGLVEDLLLLARLDQGRPLEQGPVDVAALAEDAARDARVVAPDREIALRTSGDLVAIGDEERLRQVMANLLSNALAHTPPASPVEIIVGRYGAWVRLEVVDHGPGLTDQERAKVFDRFWRADESRQRSKGGSGLGLSIVAAVVAPPRGRGVAGPTEGGGATFVVDLPVAGSGALCSAEDDQDSGDFPAEQEIPLVALPAELVDLPLGRTE